MSIAMKTVMSFVLLFGLIAMGQDAPQVVTSPVGEPAFTVPAHSAKQYKFIVPSGASSVRLEGHFAATGGPRNSIEVWVMNDDQFVNWTNRHPVQAMYNSQKVTQGTVKLSKAHRGTERLISFGAGIPPWL